MSSLKTNTVEIIAFVDEMKKLQEIAALAVKSQIIDLKTEIKGTEESEKFETNNENRESNATPNLNESKSPANKRAAIEEANEIPEKQSKTEEISLEETHPKSIIEIRIKNSQNEDEEMPQQIVKENELIDLVKTNCDVDKQESEKINEPIIVPLEQVREETVPTDAGSAEFISQILRGISTNNTNNDDKAEDKAKDKTEDKAEDKVEDKAKDKTEDKAEDKVEDKAEDKAADKSNDKTDDNIENAAAESSQIIADQLTEAEQELDLKYRETCQPFLQHVPCFKLELGVKEENLKVPRCRECLRRDSLIGVDPSDIYCRFLEFRRLQYTTEGELLVAGFPNPYTDPVQNDINIWQPDDNTEPTAGYMDVQVCRYILLHVGDQFCYLWQQEYDALLLHENPDDTIAWKKTVPDMREICDVCETTLFNYHWTCSKCGFGVCLDCFKARKEKRMRLNLVGETTRPKRGRDAFHWMLCTGAQEHKLVELMLTQIITGDSLTVLLTTLHQVRALWKIPQKCDCRYSRATLPQGPETPLINKIVDNMITESRLNQQTALSSLATKETHRQQKRLEKLHKEKINFARKLGVDYNPGRVFSKETLGKDPITTAFDGYEHINFLRKGLAGVRRFLPPKVMNMSVSALLAPNVRHEWLCDGKLLRLTDPMHPDNRILFEEVWKCGQPVMVSEVAKSLNLDLWRPEAFCKDFGDKHNDLINCLNGNLVPNQPMRHFWEGFQCIQKRLLDASGNPMLLKLKDWPPGDDFAEILPTRFADLMNGLPLPEYTLRTGNLNIASCLPKLFVPPDLGPKMYNAYGSALHPDKGTTNLHLDISDAVNVMVYVGIPQDAESSSQISAAQHAIAMGGCDFLTRLRCQNPNVMPGAIWHIFAARDADKIRDLLNRVTLEKGYRLEPDHDPIHDQSWYLDDELRERLYREYGVKGYSIVQCLGDAVFIPAGAPHQVQNLHNCIKVAEDFVSPENITHCYHLTHEFRRLSHSHTNHEDKLQIKNIIYHAVKDCCTILTRLLSRKLDEEFSKIQKAKNKRF